MKIRGVLDVHPPRFTAGKEEGGREIPLGTHNDDKTRGVLNVHPPLDSCPRERGGGEFPNSRLTSLSPDFKQV